MKKIYFCLLLLFAGINFKNEALAGHVMGADIGYTCVAPNVYSVRLKVYRDCMAITLPNTVPLNLKANTCNNGRNVTLTKVGNSRVGNPYCPAQTVTCNAGGLPTFEELTYAATVTFSATEAQCTDWTLSFNDCFRAPSGNIANATSSCFYVDSFLKLSSTINNNSPEIATLDMLNIAWNEKVTYSSYALEADGDSLVYSLQSALSNPNTPVTYNTGLSGTNPVASSPAIQINQHTGSISLIPTTVPVPGSNQYTIVVQIDEYRYINGTATRVGSTKRDMVVMVVNSQVGGVSNANPYTTNAKVNGQPLAPNAVINAAAGVPLTFEVEAFDMNPGNALTMTSDANLALPGATFNATGTPLKGTVTWTPTASQARSNLYYFRVNLKDDFCLTRGIHNQTFAVRVSNVQTPTGLPALEKELSAFTAYPNPFSNELYFKYSSKAQTIVIYNLLSQEIDRLNVKPDGNAAQHLRWENAGKHASGTYIARLIANGKALETVKFTKLQ